MNMRLLKLIHLEKKIKNIKYLIFELYIKYNKIMHRNVEEHVFLVNICKLVIECSVGTGLEWQSVPHIELVLYEQMQSVPYSRCCMNKLVINIHCMNLVLNLKEHSEFQQCHQELVFSA